MKAVFFKTDDGNMYTYEEICAITDYHERTGFFPLNFTDDDAGRFEQKYLIPYREQISKNLNR